MRIFHVVSFAAVTVALSSCTASVKGQVDAQDVPALFSAFFVQPEQDAIDPTTHQTAKLHSVAGSGVSVFDGCNGAAKQQSAFNQAFVQQTKDLDGANADQVNQANETFFDAQIAYETKNLPSD